MKGERRRIEYGTHAIEFQVVRRERRTLEIAVETNASVVVAAPIDATLEAIDAKVRKRAAWIRRQQRYFTQFLPHTPERRYVPGETHLYLGRQYRLTVVTGQTNSVKLLCGRIVVQKYSLVGTDVVKRLVDRWYRGRAKVKFAERLEANLLRFPSPERHRPKGMTIRQLRRRWGSMAPTGRLLLNIRLIEAPTTAIDYVITHELCHIAEPNHGAAFFDLLTRVMPDWPKRKERLERIMA